MFGWFKRKEALPEEQPLSWREAALFRNLEGQQLDALAPHVRERTLASGEELVREGDPADELFLLRSGSMELLKRDEDLEKDVRIDTVGAGDVVGEVALFDELPRFATVRALGKCELYVVAFRNLRPTMDLVARSSLDPRPKSMRRAYHKLLENLAGALADRLRARANETVKDERRKAAVGQFLINILILICLYTFMLSGLAQLGSRAPANTSAISIPMQILFAIGSWKFMRSTGYPLADFGLSAKHLGWSLLEAIFFTAPVLAIITGIKWVVLYLKGSSNQVPLIQHVDIPARLSDKQVLTWLSIYAFTCLVQELIVRCALQSSLQMFLTSKRKVLHAVFVSALLFSMTHLHMSFLFALLAFVPGLFWGWLFARRPNLAGVTLSHIAVGGYVFFIMGVRLQ